MADNAQVVWFQPRTLTGATETGEPAQLRNLFLRGKRLCEAGQYDCALRSFDSAIEICHKNRLTTELVDTYNHRAQVYFYLYLESESNEDLHRWKEDLSLAYGLAKRFDLQGKKRALPCLRLSQFCYQVKAFELALQYSTEAISYMGTLEPEYPEYLAFLALTMVAYSQLSWNSRPKKYRSKGLAHIEGAFFRANNQLSSVSKNQCKLTSCIVLARWAQILKLLDFTGKAVEKISEVDGITETLPPVVVDKFQEKLHLLRIVKKELGIV